MPTIIPIFRIFDYAKAVEFYVHWLEFSTVFDHAPAGAPVYARLQIRDVALDLSAYGGECSSGAKIIIENFEGLKQYHERLAAKRSTYALPDIQATPWDSGTAMLTVTDPFDNRIIFTERNDRLSAIIAVSEETGTISAPQISTIIQDINAGNPLISNVKGNDPTNEV